jgi:acetyl esterase/lipase
VSIETLRYASPDGSDLYLDLYRPARASGRLPVILFIHGGAWRAGSRTTGPDLERFFTRDGFAMASIDYRLTPAGVFPRSVEDVKTAVRYLRRHATVHDLDADRIGYWGLSAGGHLAAVAALTPRGTFEGTEWLGESSAVRCVLDAYGPAWFTTMDEEAVMEAAKHQSATARRTLSHDSPSSPESRLVGAPIQSVPERVREASPITYVGVGAPPFLIVHGTADDMVPVRQSVRLFDALAGVGADVELRLLDGVGHMFYDRTDLDEVDGPFRMEVRTRDGHGTMRTTVERAGAFQVARAFFTKHLL